MTRQPLGTTLRPRFSRLLLPPFLGSHPTSADSSRSTPMVNRAGRALAQRRADPSAGHKLSAYNLMCRSAYNLTCRSVSAS